MQMRKCSIGGLCLMSSPVLPLAFTGLRCHANNSDIITVTYIILDVQLSYESLHSMCCKE